MPIAKSLAGAAAGLAYRYAKRKFFKTGFMNYVTPSKYLRGSVRAPDAVQTTNGVLGVVSRRVSGRGCRRRRKKFTRTMGMELYKQLFQPLRVQVKVGAAGSIANSELITGGFLGINDNLPLGLVPITQNESLILGKLVFPMTLTTLRAMRNACLENNNYISVSGNGRPGINSIGAHPRFSQVGSGQYGGINPLQNTGLKNIQGVNSKYSIVGPTDVEHHFWNTSNQPCEIYVVMIRAKVDNQTNPFELMSQDVESDLANYLTHNFQSEAPASSYNLMFPAFIDPGAVFGGRLITAGVVGNLAPRLAGQVVYTPDDPAATGNTDQWQTACLLNSDKFVTPGVGPCFRRFWSVRKRRVYHLGPGEKLTVKDCIPKFRYFMSDDFVPLGNVSNGNNTGAVVPSYRSRWAYGTMIFLKGAPMADSTINAPTALNGAFGPENLGRFMPHVIHNYEWRTEFTMVGINQQAPRLELGKFFVTSREKNVVLAAAQSQVLVNTTEDDSGAPTYPIFGTAKQGNDEL